MAYDVIIIGCGIVGVSTAYELGQRGHSVLAIDRLGSGHAATSSTGVSRSIRVAYDHSFYVDLALEAIDGWRRLESENGRQILHLTGQIELGLHDKLENLARAVRAAGAKIDNVDTPDLRRLFPEIAFTAGQVGLFQGEAGTVLADAAMKALLFAAQRAGITYLAPERVVSIQAGTTPKIRTQTQTFEAAQVVVAAGPWAKELLADAGIVLPLASGVGQVSFLDAPTLVDRPGISEWPADAGIGVYGHPVPGLGYKIAFDAGSECWNPDVEEWQPDLDEQTRLLRWLAEHMPSVEPKVRLSQRDPWTMTPDEDFIIDQVGSVVIAAGCSGHAFKFGPALGRIVADIVDGGKTADLTRIDRPA